MITRSAFEAARGRAAALLKSIHVALRPDEMERIEVADFSLSDLDVIGAQILTLVDTTCIAAKLIVLFPNQTLPEHRHPPLGTYPGKEETIRCEWGTLFLGVPGHSTPNPRAHLPASRAAHFTARHERVLSPGDQLTLPPNTPHWFQAGPEGAVAWSFSTKATDVQDIFADPEIKRVTEIRDDRA